MAVPAPKRLKIDLESKKTPKSSETVVEAPEPVVEHEKDAPVSKTTTIAAEHTVVFHTPDTTLNVMQGSSGGILKSLSDGGLQHLLAGARASVSMRSGRYMFEVRIIEFIHPPDDSKQAPAKQMLRVGFSTSQSSLILGQTESFCFTSDGNMINDQVKTKGGVKFGRDDIIAVLLNLDEKSENFQTISLFANGVRASPPQKLPEVLKGKPLFPHVSFKNVTMQVNFGPKPLRALPFICKMLQEITSKDATISVAPQLPKDGKAIVLFPICLPDEGTFDWLDAFKSKNPSYAEISDRMIVDWAQKSDVWTKTQKSQWRSMDKPEVAFNVAGLDDLSVRRVLLAVAPLQPRNIIVMEVKCNLLKDERLKMMEVFPSWAFSRVARIIVGEPTAEFRKSVQHGILAERQENANKEFHAKKAIAKRQREIEKQKKKIEKERKKAEKARQKAEADVEGEKNDTTEKPVTKDDEEDDEDDEQPDDVDEEPPKLELSSEEKSIVFRKKDVMDLSAFVLSTNFTKFSLPDKIEGFDEIRCEWTKPVAKCNEYLQSWTLDKKNTIRIEDLKPSDWFHGEWARWQKGVQSWYAKQSEHRTAMAKKEAEKKAKAAKKAAARAVAERKKSAEEAAAKLAKEAKEAKEVKEAADGEGTDKKASDEEEDMTDKNVEVSEEKQESEEEDDSVSVDFEGLDIFGVDDIVDIGDGAPLCKSFEVEDWALLSLRFELHILAHAFIMDVDDPDRQGVHIDHVGFYYQKYFRKMLNLKFYGVETNNDLIKYVEDTIRLKGSIIESRLPKSLESFDVFVKIVEESRRDRARLIDLGEGSAKLKFQSGQSALAIIGKGGTFVQPVGKFSGPPNAAALGGKGGKGAIAQSLGARPAPYGFGKKGGGKWSKSW